MTSPLARYREELACALQARGRAGLRRSLEPPCGLDLCSNDYLGYARDERLARELGRRVAGTGSGAAASRLLGGELACISELEGRLAAFCQRQGSLLFPAGYQANVGLLAALLGRQDRVLSDALNHASLIDGMRLSGARVRIYAHADLAALEQALASEQPTSGRSFVVTESVFSMDGDLAPLEEICELAERYAALVVVDEAHATGLYGAGGGGRVCELGLTDRIAASVHTGGKALGVGGAWVACDAQIREHLINHCRSFVFSTAPMPAVALGLSLALERRAADDELVAALHRRARRFRERLVTLGFELPMSGSLVVPIILGSNERAMSVAASLRGQGYDVRAVRPPTVPEGSSRLRVVVRAPLSDSQLDRFASDLEQAAR